MTPAQFTSEYAEALKTASPGISVSVAKDLELKVTPPKGTETTCFLDNAYADYKQDPASKSETIQKFVSAFLESITTGSKGGLDTTRIVPIIKDAPWLEETRQALLNRGAKEVPEMVHEDFCPGLIVLYAEDTPKNMRYLLPKDLAGANIDQKDLRALACENLKKLLPPIQREGTNGLYMLTAGGDYEASLLLIDSIWDAKKLEVEGDIVVAVPNRDLLLVSGTGSPEAIAKMKEIAKKSAAEGSYRLTTKLFVRRDGKFEEFDK